MPYTYDIYKDHLIRKYVFSTIKLRLVLLIFGFAMMMTNQSAWTTAIFRFEDLYIDGTLTRQRGYNNGNFVLGNV